MLNTDAKLTVANLARQPKRTDDRFDSIPTNINSDKYQFRQQRFLENATICKPSMGKGKGFPEKCNER
jgi:hypothetical protein